MRSDSDIIVIIIAVLVAVFIFSQIFPKIVSAQTGTADLQTPKVQEWTSLVISDLSSSTSVPKKASTPVISFTDPKDNCLLGEEFAYSLGNSVNMSKIMCNCKKSLVENEWKVCTSTECTQTENVVDVVNEQMGILAEQSYVLTVSGADNFTWLCIEVEARGNETQ